MSNPELKTGPAQALRKRMTLAERRLWQRLRAARFHGLKFRRQQPIGPHIVDFYCAVARLVIELDGDAHAFTARNDKIRQQFLESEGFTVIRFPNFEVNRNTGFVLEQIYVHCQAYLCFEVPESNGPSKHLEKERVNS